MKIILILLVSFCCCNLQGQSGETTIPETDEKVVNQDSALNASLQSKIKLRIAKIRLLNSTFASYSPVVTPAISTDCFNVKSAVLNVLSTKWKEMLFDKQELEKLGQLKILNPEDQDFNEFIIDLRKEFQLIASDTGIGINSKLDFESNQAINSILNSFQANFYRFERINEICLSILN